jgi:hypothetical protein
MKKKHFLLLVILVLPFLSAHAQGFQLPSPGKAAIYFVRVTAAGFAISFDFYHNDKYIGDFAGKNYMRYESEPGQHLFWASSENHEFMTAELKEGDTYVVVVDVEMGFAIARVGLTPITSTDKVYDRVKKLVDKKAPKVNTDEEVNKRNEMRAEYIQDKVKHYEEKLKIKRTYKHLSPEMAIPLSASNRSL